MPDSSLRAVALPTEHGGWSLTLEPVILGLLVAPSLSGFALGLTALLAFVARTPIRTALVDRRRGHWRQRSRLAALVAGIELIAIGVFGTVAVVAAESAFWWPLAAALPPIAVELWYDIRSRSRRLAPELAGAIGIGAVAAAVVLVGGGASDMAAGVWLVIAARSVAAVAFVRVQLRRAKQQEHRVWHSDLGQAAAVAMVITGVALDVVPVLAVAAMVAVALFDTAMVRRPPVSAPVLGSQQIVLGLLVVIVTGLAVNQ